MFLVPVLKNHFQEFTAQVLLINNKPDDYSDATHGSRTSSISAMRGRFGPSSHPVRPTCHFDSLRPTNSLHPPLQPLMPSTRLRVAEQKQRHPRKLAIPALLRPFPSTSTNPCPSLAHPPSLRTPHHCLRPLQPPGAVAYSPTYEFILMFLPFFH